MAKDADGDYYYDAGTINEQLDDYEVYEKDGRLFINNEAADPQEAISFGGLTQYLQEPRATGDVPTTDEIADGETALYTRVTTGTTDGVSLFAAYNNSGTILETEIAVLEPTT